MTSDYAKQKLEDDLMKTEMQYRILIEQWNQYIEFVRENAVFPNGNGYFPDSISTISEWGKWRKEQREAKKGETK